MYFALVVFTNTSVKYFGFLELSRLFIHSFPSLRPCQFPAIHTYLPVVTSIHSSYFRLPEHVSCTRRRRRCLDAAACNGPTVLVATSGFWLWFLPPCLHYFFTPLRLLYYGSDCCLLPNLVSPLTSCCCLRDGLRCVLPPSCARTFMRACLRHTGCCSYYRPPPHSPSPGITAVSQCSRIRHRSFYFYVNILYVVIIPIMVVCYATSQTTNFTNLQRPNSHICHHSVNIRNFIKHERNDVTSNFTKDKFIIKLNAFS